MGVDICPTEALIKVEKQTVPDGDPDFFEFEGALAGSIRDGEFITALAEAGEYTVTVPAFPRFDIR